MNKSTRDGKFPVLWKLARVTPSHKADDKLKVENYRSMSILPVLSKILERAVHAQLTEPAFKSQKLFYIITSMDLNVAIVLSKQLHNSIIRFYNIWIKAKLLVY